MMQKLKEEITAAANRELNRANEQFPLFTSKHEGVAVAYEELEEEAKSLLMRYAPDIYETEFEKIPEAQKKRTPIAKVGT